MKPTPTPEMIEAGEKAIDALDYATMPVGDIHREIARAAISAALSVPAAAVVGEPVAWRYKLENWGPEYWQYFTKEPRHKEPGEVWQPLYVSPCVPSGWKLVPIDPTPEMLVDIAKACRDFLSEDGPYPRAKAVYRATISSAPKPNGANNDA